jgi:hypothetical protein
VDDDEWLAIRPSARRHGISDERIRQAMAVIQKDGRIVTDEDLDRMADEFEAGVDISKWRPVPWRGRPSLSAGPTTPGTHSPRVATRIPIELREELLAYATQEGKTMSQLLRGLLEAYVRQRRAEATGRTGPRDHS